MIENDDNNEDTTKVKRGYKLKIDKSVAVSEHLPKAVVSGFRCSSILLTIYGRMSDTKHWLPLDQGEWGGFSVVPAVGILQGERNPNE